LRNLAYDPEHNPYIHPGHSIQQEILRTFAQMCGLSTARVHIGIDGCSAPNFAIPLRNAALGFARLCDPARLPQKRQRACRVIVNAMTSYPFMVGGPSTFDTDLMEATHGKILTKGGAEGYQGVGILPGVVAPGAPALGIALKISDGDHRAQARAVITLEVLRQLNALSEEELKVLSGYGPSLTLTNARSLTVGQASPIFTLNRP
jgi:L-asparaginase II